ncbi:hypothetical protein [Frigoribacterium sp. VKM Ac-2530]|uniref:hypothetical protein n=1 Tax=Frigoribacterium sp. VKM Ac-2530 TaxID=2783822 RepID=UPI00188D4476|nr:hypothetical protein [Frigoribacterium sp. VKM Ac-2530]MBF4578914.1 hypothetical protein [Frigoribacterium sp. VKM Ac-2530]
MTDSTHPADARPSRPFHEIESTRRIRLEALVLAERTLSAGRIGVERETDGSDVLNVAADYLTFITTGKKPTTADVSGTTAEASTP